MVRALALAARLDDEDATTFVSSPLYAFPRSARLADALADIAGRSSQLLNTTLRELPRFLEDVASGLATLDRVAPAWDTLRTGSRTDKAMLAYAESSALAALVQAFGRAPDEEAVLACLTSRRRSTLAHRAALAIGATAVIDGGAAAIARLRVLRPELAGDPVLFAAVLRQERVTAITDAVRAMLPVPELPPFEELGERLFAIEGLAPLLDRWTPKTREALLAWQPSGWQIAWERYRGGAVVRDALFAIAAETPADATGALELLATFGDQARVQEIARLGRGKPGAALDTKAKARHWKTIDQCILCSLAVAAFMKEVQQGRMPQKVMRAELGHIVDEHALALAKRALRDGDGERDPLDVLVARSRYYPVDLRPEIAALLARGDTRTLVRLLTERTFVIGELDPETIACIWQVEDARIPLAQAIARFHDGSWPARARAAERAAAKLGLPDACDGLFEACVASFVAVGPGWATLVETLDELRTVIRIALTSGSPEQAIKLYGTLRDELSASLFVRAMRRLPRDRVAALRDAANRFGVEDRNLAHVDQDAETRKAWLLRDGP